MLFSLDNNWWYTSVNSKAGEILGRIRGIIGQKTFGRNRCIQLSYGRNG
jgi:hypothetical protein